VVATPLAFLGNHALAIAGAAMWGVALGAQNSILTAGVALLVPESIRARAFGTFSAIFGIAWFAGSALMGTLYDVSLTALVAASVFAEFAALIPFALALRASR
jgi:hypothetical protein